MKKISRPSNRIAYERGILEALAACAAVAPVEVVAEMAAAVGAGRALVHVHALLAVSRRDDVAREASADVAARRARWGRDVSAELFAATCKTKVQLSKNWYIKSLISFMKRQRRIRDSCTIEAREHLFTSFNGDRWPASEVSPKQLNQTGLVDPSFCILSENLHKSGKRFVCKELL